MYVSATGLSYFYLLKQIFTEYFTLRCIIQAPILRPFYIKTIKHLNISMICLIFVFFIVADQDLEELIVEIVRANDRGVSAVRNVTGEPNWSFGQSFFFSSTVVTTIGRCFEQDSPQSRINQLLYSV